MKVIKTQRIQVHEEPSALHVCLQRPARYNAVDVLTLRELRMILDQYYDYPGALILQGTRGVFSLGADLYELSKMSAHEAFEYSLLAHRCAERIESWPRPTLALLDGYALGAGYELCLSCDVIWAGPDSFVGIPGLAWSLMPSMGGLQRLMARTHFVFAQDAFLTGKIFDCEEALEHGMVNHLLDREHDDLDALLHDFSEFSSTAVSNIRSLRLEKQGLIKPKVNAELFAEPFMRGEVQVRLQELIDQ